MSTGEESWDICGVEDDRHKQLHKETFKQKINEGNFLFL